MPRKRGRPLAVEEHSWVPAVCEGLSQGQTRAEACRTADISYTALRMGMDNHEWIADAVIAAEEYALERVSGVLMRIATDDDHPDQFKAAKWIAETRLKQWKRDAQRVDISVQHSLQTDPVELEQRAARVIERIEQRALSAAADEAEILEETEEP